MGSRGFPYAGGGPHCRGFPYGWLGEFLVDLRMRNLCYTIAWQKKKKNQKKELILVWPVV